MSHLLPFEVAMAILIPGQYWPVPAGTELNCDSCGAPAKYICEIAGYPTAEWALECDAHRTGRKQTLIPFEALYFAPPSKNK
jgi:hypothetical protein